MRVCVLRGSLLLIVNNCESLLNVENGQASPSFKGFILFLQRFHTIPYSSLLFPDSLYTLQHFAPPSPTLCFFNTFLNILKDC